MPVPPPPDAARRARRAVLLSREEIAEARRRHPILDVLARLGIDTPTSGTSIVVHCPVPGHEDRTPSCLVHPDTDRYYCFGCGSHGDVFTLLTAVTGTRSLAAIRDLLDSSGPLTTHPTHLHPVAPGAAISRPIEEPPGAARLGLSAVERPRLDRTPLDRVLQVNDQAWRFLTQPGAVTVAHGYLASRGIDVSRLERLTGRPVATTTPTTAAGAPGVLTAHLRGLGFTVEEISDAGWVSVRADRVSDRFTRRLLVPIRDQHDRVLGVIGRDLSGHATTRYLNTAHTIAFCKGEHLYTPLHGTPGPGQRVIVCEGVLDALALATTNPATAARDRLGVFPVAPSGTALTVTQARHIATLAARRDILLCPDGDPAGRAAAGRWADLLHVAGAVTRELALPEGHDPASWLTYHSPDHLPDLLAGLLMAVGPRRDPPQHSLHR